MIYKLPASLVISGLICLSGCNQKGQLCSCPPFPDPHPLMKQELQSVDEEHFPYFVDWVNRLYKLKRQLEERRVAF